MNIQWVGAAAANFAVGRRAGFPPQAIVIHVMAGSLAGTDSWFNDTRAAVSAHYGVGAAGELHQYVKEVDTAFHAGTVDRPAWALIKPGVNPNYYTVGVEHEGSGDGPWPWPQPQLAASLVLVRDIARRWNIPIDTDHIIPHHLIRFAKPCPGDNFDHADYVARLLRTPPPAVGGPEPVEPAIVHAVATANVRLAPTTASSIVRVLAKGDTFAVTGVASNGQGVAGSSLWFGGAAGEFLWAGATDRPSGFE